MRIVRSQIRIGGKRVAPFHGKVYWCFALVFVLFPYVFGMSLMVMVIRAGSRMSRPDSPGWV